MLSRRLQLQAMIGETGHSNAPANAALYVDSFESEKPHDECGVIGIYAADEVANLTYRGLKALQHRGQNGAGLSVFFEEADRVMTFKGVGMVDAAIPEAVPGPDGRNHIDTLMQSSLAIGHTRYSTGGNAEASQPFAGERTGIAVAHNGHIEDISEVAERYGITSGAASDSALLTELIDLRTAELGDVQLALDELLPQLEGAYCLTILDGANSRLIGVRDPWGYHPLVLGQFADGGYMLASETSALDRTRATFLRDVEPGEIITVDADGAQSRLIDRQVRPQHCMFEYVYTASPTSVIDGRSVYLARKNLGKALARQNLIDADIVVGVPESGLPIAAGYAEESGLPLVQGILKDPYSVRSFLLAGQSRKEALRDKHTPNRFEIAGKRVVLGDDSVIKGNTMQSFTEILRDAGATEIHIVSGASRYEFICRMGMDTGDVSELIAVGRTDEEIAHLIGADSITYNTPDAIETAINDAQVIPGKEWPVGALCTACATGDYALQSRTFQKIAASRDKAVPLGMPSIPVRT